MSVGWIRLAPALRARSVITSVFPTPGVDRRKTLRLLAAAISLLIGLLLPTLTAVAASPDGTQVRARLVGQPR